MARQRFEWSVECSLPTAVNEGERAVEIPLVREFLRGVTEGRWPAPATIVELGAVTPYWFKPGDGIQLVESAPRGVPWPVYDLYDAYPAALQQDICTAPIRGHAVITISTLEHIGMGHYGGNAEQRKPEDAATLLHRILDEAPVYFITWPLGINPALDAAGIVRAARGTPTVIVEQVENHVYVPRAPSPRTWDLRYNEPHPYSNGTVVMSNALPPATLQ